MESIVDHKLKEIDEMAKEEYRLGVLIKEEFPWEDVKSCQEYTIPALFGHFPCPICGKTSESLNWIRFVSPEWTWHHLMGIGGLLSICQGCHQQVEYIGFIRN